MPRDPFSALGWADLHDRLGELRAELEALRRGPMVDLKRYRTMKAQVSACVSAIANFHRRAAGDRDTPPDNGLRPLDPGGHSS